MTIRGKELTVRVPATARSHRRRAISGTLAVLVLALSGGLVAACGGGANATVMPTTDASVASGAEMPGAASHDPGTDAAAVETAWAARPDYVRGADARVQEAYRYALERPDVIRWMPCYCGCASMQHRSNLDCFLRARMTAGAVAFEQHASFCDVCVQTALLAKQRIGEGRSLAEIRAEVDATFGGNGVPGTPTDLPKG
jgi:Protein of unknown function with PCYCGC motif